MASFTVTQEMIDYATSKGCDFYRLNALVTVGRVINTGTQISFRPHEGVKILKAFFNQNSGSEQRLFDDNGQYFYRSWGSSDVLGTQGFTIEVEQSTEKQFTVTQNLINSLQLKSCVMSISGNPITNNQVVITPSTLVINISSNNIFTEQGVYCVDKSTDANHYFTLSNSNKTATLNYDNTMNIVSDSFIVNTQSENKNFTVNQSLLNKLSSNNAVMSVNGINVSLNQIITAETTITVKSNDGYIFKNGFPYFTDVNTDKNYLFSVTDGGKRADIIFTKSMNLSATLFYVETELEPEIDTPFIIDQQFLNIVSNNNSKAYINDVEVALNNEFKSNDVMKIISNDQYSINKCYFIDRISGVNYYFNISQDSKNATLLKTSSMVLSSNYFTLEVIYTPIDIVSVTNNYYVTNSQYDEFVKRMYSILAVERASESPTVPISDFLNKVMIYPFKISDDNISGISNIKIRNENLSTGYLINSDYIKLDFGIIDLAKKIQGSIYNIGSKLELYLPYCTGSISIPNEMLGKMFTIEGVVNINDGQMTLTLTDIDSDYAFVIESVKIGSEYPFITINDVIEKNFSPSHAVNDILSAYVILTIPNYGGQKIKSNDSGILKDVLGSVTVSDIKLEVKAPSLEIELIQSLLKSGVYIND